jgi:3-oxoacyl-[acyl-carrier-protein] synthase III
MQQWKYCEVDFNGRTTKIYFYDEAGDFINNPTEHLRLGIMLAELGHDGWNIVSNWWPNRNEVTYMLKRPLDEEWTAHDRARAKEKYVAKPKHLK